MQGSVELVVMLSCILGTTESTLAMQGKVVFVAPTRPLVTQQIDACRRSVGIPEVCIICICKIKPFSEIAITSLIILQQCSGIALELFCRTDARVLREDLKVWLQKHIAKMDSIKSILAYVIPAKVRNSGV